MALKFFLDFKTAGHGKYYITEPQGMDAADFSIIRGDGRLGIDVMYAGQEGSFRLGIQSHRDAIKRLWHDLSEVIQTKVMLMVKDKL